MLLKCFPFKKDLTNQLTGFYMMATLAFNELTWQTFPLGSLSGYSYIQIQQSFAGFFKIGS